MAVLVWLLQVFTCASMTPHKCHLPWGDPGPHLHYSGSVDPQIPQLKWYLDHSTIFAGLTVMTDRETTLQQ